MENFWGRIFIFIALSTMVSSIPHPREERNIKICAERLLFSIQKFCIAQVRSQSHSSVLDRGRRAMDFMRNMEHSLPYQRMHTPTRIEIEIEDEPASDETRNGEIQKARWNIVEACCRRSCPESEFQKYCNLSPISVPGVRITPPPTTTTEATTTTTTPVPTLHRLHVPRTSRLSPREKKMRQAIITDAIACLYDPKCGKLEGTSRTKTSKPFSRFCPNSAMTKEEKQTHLLPILLRLLSWGTYSKSHSSSSGKGSDEIIQPPSHPTPNARVAEINLHREQEAEQGQMEVYSDEEEIENEIDPRFFPNMHGKTTSTHHFPEWPPSRFPGLPFPPWNNVQDPDHDHGSSAIKHEVETDSPILAHLGIGVGTNDRILFNH